MPNGLVPNFSSGRNPNCFCSSMITLFQISVVPIDFLKLNYVRDLSLSDQNIEPTHSLQ